MIGVRRQPFRGPPQGSLGGAGAGAWHGAGKAVSGGGMGRADGHASPAVSARGGGGHAVGAVRAGSAGVAIVIF